MRRLTLPDMQIETLTAARIANPTYPSTVRIPVFSRRFALVALCGALALTTLEGAGRKWIVGSDIGFWSYIFYFSKDFVFLALIVLPSKQFVPESLRVFKRSLVSGGLLAAVGLGLSALKAFSLVGAVLTLRAVILLPIVAYLGTRRIDWISIRTIAWLLAIMTAANFLLGVIQNGAERDSIINRYASTTTEITAVETGVRATGTYSYISGMALMAFVGIWAGLVLLSLATNSADRIAGWLAILSGFGCSLTSVSRGPVVTGALMLLIWGFKFRGGLSNWARTFVAATLIVLIVAYSGAVPVLSQLGEGLIQRTDTSDDSFSERAFGEFRELPFAISAAPTGRGLGSEQVAGNYFQKGEMSFTTFENQFPRLIMETGVLGFLGFLVICGGALVSLQVAKHYAEGEQTRSVLSATQLFLASMFYLNVVFNHTASAFAWLIFVSTMAGCSSMLNRELRLRFRG
jgi:O-Antigen ligase